MVFYFAIWLTYISLNAMTVFTIRETTSIKSLIYKNISITSLGLRANKCLIFGGFRKFIVIRVSSIEFQSVHNYFPQLVYIIFKALTLNIDVATVIYCMVAVFDSFPVYSYLCGHIRCSHAYVCYISHQLALFQR